MCFMASGHFKFFWLPLKNLEVGICVAPAGKEDQVKHQQGKKTLSHTSREKKTLCASAGKEDPFAHQQGKKTLLSLKEDIIASCLALKET